MALFESYERRIDQINAVLNSYGISSIEEAEKITKDAGLDVYNMVRAFSLSASRTLAGLILSVQLSQSRRVLERLQKLLQLSVKVFRHSVFRVQLLTRERLVLDMVILVRCFLKKIQSVSLS